MAVADDDLLAAGHVEHELERLRREVLHRGVEVPSVPLAQRLEDAEVPAVRHGHPRPGDERAVRDRAVPVGDESLRVDLEPGADPRAVRACAVRRVEREAPRLELVDRRAVIRAAVPLAVPALLEVGLLALPGRRRDEHHALPEPERRLDRIREPGRVGRGEGLSGRRVQGPALGVTRRIRGCLGAADDEAVDDDLDRVPPVLVQGGRLGEVVHLPVHADPHEALLACGVEDPIALGLAVLDERAQDHEPRPLGQAVDLVHHLLDALALDLPAARGAVRVADAGEEEPQVVVDLRHGADGGPGVPARALLVDRDGRRKPVDLVDVRLLHLAEELPRVRRQALDIPALALRVDGVEREAALPRAGQAGDDDEPVARERDGDVLEVVLARAANDDRVLGHGTSVAQVDGLEQAFDLAQGRPVALPDRGPELAEVVPEDDEADGEDDDGDDEEEVLEDDEDERDRGEDEGDVEQRLEHAAPDDRLDRDVAEADDEKRRPDP